MTWIDLTPKQWETHKDLWDENADLYKWYEFVKEINPELTMKQWDHAWQWLVINNPSYKQAKAEFLMAVNQAY